MTKIDEEKGLSKTKFTKIDLNKLFETSFLRIGNLIISGSDQLETENVLLSKLLMEWVELLKKVLYSPIYTLMPFESDHLFLRKEFNRLKDIPHKQAVIIEQYLRKQELKKVKTESLLDKVLQHNEECRTSGNLKDVLSMEDILGMRHLAPVRRSF